MNIIYSLLFMLLLGQVEFPSLEDGRLDKIWKESIEYDYPKLCLNRNQYMDARFEIGPFGQRNTLAGMEFPWRDPGGRFRSDLSRTFRSNGARFAPVNARYKDIPNTFTRGPVTYIVSGVRDYYRPAWQWEQGTVFFELHYHPKGHPFELRILEKISDGYGFDNYDAYVFRPVNEERELPKLAKLTGRTFDRSVTSGHPTNAFVARGRVTIYPDPEEEINWNEFVLGRDWIDSTGHDWHHGGAGEGFLSPREYQGWMVGSDRETCSKCHDTAGAPVEKFELTRDWYGFVPGADGTFSTGPPPEIRGRVGFGHTRVR